ncbi:hypothetical protein JOC86_004240 [Bacillus pakistanensis]|uniref:Uncharacterized protein n=1 Tax=Rossellomorea pakistanensis TaxID=992288 RepID=A0ABS2NJG5_9BACI|nr:hypothetical protein [Bacillus pakistanensis]MBM7587666.1 hypothetical protein [Bacillus pakistanensis]
MRRQVREWIKDLLESFHPQDGDRVYNLIVEWTHDQLEIYIRITKERVTFGYGAIQWDGPHSPVPTKIDKYSLDRQELELAIDRSEMLLDYMIKTINSRKRQYRFCQFCHKKFPPEHRFDSKTCHGCASKEYFVVY